MHVSKAGDPDEREAEAVSEKVVVRGSNETSAANIHPAISSIQRIGDPTKVPPGLGEECEIASDSPLASVEQLLFPNDGFTLSALQQAQIDNFVLNWRAAGGNAPMRVDGYASIPATDEHNWRLSCNRAEAVVNELTTPSSGIPGIPAGFIRTVAQGETTEFGAEASNRRATISSPVPISPPAPTCTPGTGIPNTVCSAYAANSWWLPQAYVGNATCACSTTPNISEYNCIRKFLQDRLAAAPPTLKTLAASQKHLESGDTLEFLAYEGFVLDNLTPIIYKDHVDAYRSCCCPSGPAPYAAWKGVTTVPLVNCSLVGEAIKWTGNCRGTPGTW
jgi:outer membrane protein OmpA-like peptidoglycan-associated protein